MKYHYFHGRFTYSVKRSGPVAPSVPQGKTSCGGCDLSLISSVEECAVGRCRRGWLLRWRTRNSLRVALLLRLSLCRPEIIP